MAHARLCVIPFAGEHAHLLDATDKVPPRVLHFNAFHVIGNETTLCVSVLVEMLNIVGERERPN